MRLHLERNLTSNFWGSTEYALYVSLDCNTEELQIIDQHRFGKNVLYEIPEVQTFQQRADSAFERSNSRSCFKSAEAGKLIADTFTGLIYTARSKMAYSLVVADAVYGTTVTCSDLLQLLDCETAINQTFDQLAIHVQEALAFELGRAEVLAPENEPEPAGLAPAHWGNPHLQWGRN